MQKITNKIALEEHFSAPRLQPSIKDVAFFDPEVLRAIEVALPEFQDQRLRAMDQAGISIAVLSQTAPGVQSIRDSVLAAELAHEANDFLHRRIETAPKRFRGFACLALQDVDRACDELKRCIQELGFVGALVNGSTNGAYLDEPQFAPFWHTLEQLDVPFYLHPGLPTDHPQAFRGHPELEGPVWRWTCDTATHVLRLVFGGVFDRHHTARLILGHMGETLPYMLWRLDSRAAVTTVGRGLSRPPAETLRHHVMVTTSGVCADAPLRCALEAMGAEAVMFSTDYPYEDIQVAANWIENADLPDDQRIKVCVANAERLLRLG
ncbi:amidohydrolase [Synechococcus sp. Tobar12-5m-g]|uniref:amidohydrolase family protein n=1 Tax=unclassified Synechococcus TaxID=2626047 RepID=UPI0020CD85A1|nr:MULTISPECIES: amidohydrolase family protein [unclassified Synechococcus]MCP9771432.1 amidohydrolase [Synechococcus sp. Tobar12-5m-g]MCP9872371.1 amidohydrolase [Synechococcus sp. Cruz CV-v-12]